MTKEAKLKHSEHGLVPDGEGWFVVNAAEAQWHANGRFGEVCVFQGEARCPGLGVNIHVIHPGQSNCLYHRESEPEAFLVLDGECVALIDGEERPLKQWDYFHCPPGVNHVFVGAGDGPCAILMIGRRAEGSELYYPKNELAAKHGASTLEETPNPREAYAGSPEWVEAKAAWPVGASR